MAADRSPAANYWLQIDSQLPWGKLQEEASVQTPQKEIHICNPSCSHFGNQAGSKGVCDKREGTVSVNGLCVLPNRRQRIVFGA